MSEMNNMLDEFKSQIDDIVKELETNPEKINELTDEQVLEVDKYLNPYGATIYGEDKYTCVSFTNLKEKYMQRLLMTGLVGFLYQMNKEYEIDDDDLNEVYLKELDKDAFYEDIPHPDSKNKEFVNKLNETLYIECKYKYLQDKYASLDEESKEESADEETYYRNYKLSEEEEMNIQQNVNMEVTNRLKPTKYFNNEKFLAKKYELVKQQSEEEKVISRFLNKFFKYNPSEHTSEVLANINDPEKLNQQIQHF